MQLSLTGTLNIPCEALGDHRGMNRETPRANQNNASYDKESATKIGYHTFTVKYKTCMPESQTTCIGSTKDFIRLITTVVAKEKITCKG